MVGDIFLSYLRPPHIKSRAVNSACKLAAVTGKWDKFPLELWLVYTRDNNILLNFVSA